MGKAYAERLEIDNQKMQQEIARLQSLLEARNNFNYEQMNNSFNAHSLERKPKTEYPPPKQARLNMTLTQNDF